MTYKTTTFGNVPQGRTFYYDNQRWHKRTTALERSQHNAYTLDGKRYKWFSRSTQVKVEVK